MRIEVKRETVEARCKPDTVEKKTENWDNLFVQNMYKKRKIVKK